MPTTPKKLTPQAKKFIQGVRNYLRDKDKPIPPKQYRPTTVLVRK